MLPPRNRLRKTREIERVFQEGSSFKEGSLLLKSVKNGLTVSRFTFIVGQKTAKKATQRNKIKRRLRDIVKKNLPHLKKGLDIIVVTLKGAETKTYKELEGSAQKLFKKAGLLQS